MGHSDLETEDDVDMLIKEELHDLGYTEHTDFTHKEDVVTWCGRTSHRGEADFVLSAEYNGFEEPVYIIESKAPGVDVTASHRIKQARSYAVWTQGEFLHYTPYFIVYNGTRAVKYDTLAMLNSDGANRLSSLIPETKALPDELERVTKEHLE